MQILNRKIRLLFGFSLGLSVGLPLGILGIVFGAVRGWWPLLAAGITLTVAGFYIMPLLWVGFASRRQCRTLYRLITEERLHTVAVLSAQTGYGEKDVLDKIKWMISTRVLTGYIFENGSLGSNEPEKEPPLPPTRPCPNCGAMMHLSGEHYQCDYCLTGEAAR